MKFSKLLLAASTAVACLAGGTAHSAVTLTSADSLSPFSNFGGFDWAAGGAAWTDGITAAETAFKSGGIGDPGNVFTLRFATLAVGLIDPSKAAIPTANLDATADGGFTGAGTYEYTIFSTINLRVTSYIDLTAASGGFLVCAPPPCVFITVETLAGSTFDIYYDTTANALQVDGGAWTGFKNGVATGPLISGSIMAGQVNTFNDVSPVNGFGISGIVTGQDTNYVNPILGGTRFTSEFLFGLADGGFKTPLSVDGHVVNQDPAVEDIFSVDASQLFFQTPEPISLLLVGGALVAAGGASRRKSKR